MLGQLAGGFGVRYLPKMKWQTLVCAVMIMVFFAALASSNPNSRSRSIVLFTLGMIGGGYIESLVLSAMALVWEPDDIGLVSGVLCAIRTASGAIATSMYTSILATELNTYLPKYVAPAALSAGLPKSNLKELPAGIPAGAYTSVPGVDAQVLKAIAGPIQHAYTVSYRTMWLCTLPFGVITIIAAFLTPNVEDYMTDEVGRKLQAYRGDAQSAGISNEKVGEERRE